MPLKLFSASAMLHYDGICSVDHAFIGKNKTLYSFDKEGGEFSIYDYGQFQEVTEVAMFKLFRQSWGNKQHAEQLAEKAGIALKEIEIGDIQGNGKLDIVFSFDTTHSMTAYLNQVRDNLKDITNILTLV